MRAFYFNNLVLLIYLGFVLFALRYGFESYFRFHKIGRNNIKKSTKGMKNYWWYELLHQKYGFDKPYRLNKVFTVLFAAAFLMQLVLGWITILSIPMAALFCTCLLASIPANYFALTQYNLNEHGRKIVFFSPRKNGRGYDLFCVQLFWFLLPFGEILAELKMICSIWQ
jgi:hypothetical protein